MKMVVAVVRPDRLSFVKSAVKMTKAERMSVRVKSANPDSRVFSSPKVRVEVFTEDNDADGVVDAIEDAAFPNGAHSAKDGTIFVVSLDHSRDSSNREQEALPVRAG